MFLFFKIFDAGNYFTLSQCKSDEHTDKAALYDDDPAEYIGEAIKDELTNCDLLENKVEMAQDDVSWKVFVSSNDGIKKNDPNRYVTGLLKS